MDIFCQEGCLVPASFIDGGKQSGFQFHKRENKTLKEKETFR